MARNALPQILFVDDEDKILSGIKRMLRPYRTDWDIQTANSAREALNLLDDNDFDIIISDMRMPEMDGASLLLEVKERSPETIRVILSGFSERESIIKTVGPSHQFLAKPCDDKTLVNMITRCLSLKAFIASEELMSLVAGITTLPSPPSVCWEVLSEIDNELASAKTLSEIVSKDVSLSAQILRLTNSAYFSLPSRVDTIEQAITMLGLDTLKALVLVGGILNSFKGDSRTIAILESLSEKSMTMAAATRNIAIAEELSQEIIEDLFCASVLAHIGTLLMASQWPDKFRLAMANVDRGECSVSEAEFQVFGANHAVLGAYLLGIWGFNSTITEAVAYHHAPNACVHKESATLAILHAVQFYGSGLSEVSHSEHENHAALDVSYISAAGFGEKELGWREIFKQTAIIEVGDKVDG